jgi:hypothetical protein
MNVHNRHRIAGLAVTAIVTACAVAGSSGGQNVAASPAGSAPSTAYENVGNQVSAPIVQVTATSGPGSGIITFAPDEPRRHQAAQCAALTTRPDWRK